MPNVNIPQQKQEDTCGKQKRKLPRKTHSSRKKKQEKVVFYGFECPYCPQTVENDSEQEVEDKYLQRLILCRKSTYNSTNKGHSLWVNLKAVHCRNFHSHEDKYPNIWVKDEQLVSSNSEGTKVSKKNLVKYELTREQYSRRNVLNSKRKRTSKSKLLLFSLLHINFFVRLKIVKN